jgi:hypothetical protein
MQIPSQHESDPKSKGRERRRWERADADLPLRFSLNDEKREARVRDLSRAGVCFFLDRPIPLMTVLEVSLELRVDGGVRRVGGYGAVVRCEKIAKAVDHYEIAVFMHDMAEADRGCIESFVRARQQALRG